MLTTWEGYLYFYYVEVEPSQMDIKQLEQKLLDTFTPPYSQEGYSAAIKCRSQIIKSVKIMKKKLYLPSLRGIMGDWVYYPTLMKLKDIVERVKIAEEIYQSKTLSEMVQREIKRKRGKEIKDYLLKHETTFL